MGYFDSFIERVKDTKKFAREKNVPVWEIPLVNSIGIILLTSIYLSIYTWMGIVNVEEQLKGHFWWDSMISVATFLPLIYLVLIVLTVLDRVLRVFIIFQSVTTKIIFNAIQKADHKIWRKTGKDSYIANKIWWVQNKWMGLPKKKRRLIFFGGVSLYLSWYLVKLFT